MLRTLLLSTALLLPVAAAAESPPPVTEIRAERVANGVRVTWAPVPGPIARYQVYYNTESILENGGAYEDFDLTENATASYLLTGPITSGAVYVSVIAEGFSGEDSGFFVEEASVPAPGRNGPQLIEEPAEAASSSSTGPSMVTEEPTGADIPVVAEESSSSSSSAEPPASSSSEASIATSSASVAAVEISSAERASSSSSQEPEPIAEIPAEEDPALTAMREAMQTPFRLHAVYAFSPNHVRLFFSHDVLLDDEAGNAALLLQDDAGRTVALKRFMVDGNMLTAETVSPLRAGTRYTALVGSGVRGSSPEYSSVTHAIHPLARAAYFFGAAVPKTGANDIPRIALNALPDGDATYMIQAAWEFPAKQNDISGFVVAQSTDDGKTETGEHTVPFGVNAIEYHGVAAGALTLRVRTLSMKGGMSSGLASTITLLPLHSPEPILRRGTPQPAAPLAASVIAPATPAVPASSGLSHSGAALGLALLGAGSAAAVARLRRRKAALA